MESTRAPISHTVGGTQYISDIVTLCGGRNVFDDLSELAPAVSVEAVIDRNPDVIGAGHAGHCIESVYAVAAGTHC